MVKTLVLLSVVLALMLAACAPERSPSLSTAPTVSASQLEKATVVYHRSGGLMGAIDTWTIAADGTLSKQGQATGAARQLSATQMTELTAAIRAANFMSLESSYVPQDTCCDRYLYEITVTLGEQSKTVRTIDASPTAPAELGQLIDTLNRLVTPPK
jgi:hypothetical protein